MSETKLSAEVTSCPGDEVLLQVNAVSSPGGGGHVERYVLSRLGARVLARLLRDAAEVGQGARAAGLQPGPAPCVGTSPLAAAAKRATSPEADAVRRLRRDNACRRSPLVMGYLLEHETQGMPLLTALVGLVLDMAGANERQQEQLTWHMRNEQVPMVMTHPPLPDSDEGQAEVKKVQEAMFRSAARTTLAMPNIMKAPSFPPVVDREARDRIAYLEGAVAGLIDRVTARPTATCTGVGIDPGDEHPPRESNLSEEEAKALEDSFDRVARLEADRRGDQSAGKVIEAGDEIAPGVVAAAALTPEDLGVTPESLGLPPHLFGCPVVVAPELQALAVVPPEPPPQPPPSSWRDRDPLL